MFRLGPLMSLGMDTEVYAYPMIGESKVTVSDNKCKYNFSFCLEVLV